MDLVGLRDMHGGELIGKLSQHELAEAINAAELLKLYDIGLLECVRGWIADRHRRQASVTFGQAWEAYSGLKKRSPEYEQELRHAKAKVEHLSSLQIVAITAKHGDVRKLLLQTGHTSPSILFRHYHRAMSSEKAARYWSIVPQ